MKSKSIIALELILFMTLMPCSLSAVVQPNGEDDQTSIAISTVRSPKQHHFVDIPEAEYNTVAGTLTITLDAVSYSEYTITLSSGYANVDYYPTSAVVVFPASALSEITYIYIDSEDCGTYEGVLDMNDIGNTY